MIVRLLRYRFCGQENFNPANVIQEMELGELYEYADEHGYEVGHNADEDPHLYYLEKPDCTPNEVEEEIWEVL